MKLLFVIVMFSYVVQAQEIGFGATEFQIHPITGSAIMGCNNGAVQIDQVFECHDERLSPYEQAFFQGPTGIRADSIHIFVKREDGSNREKDSGYDNKNYRSDSRLNLWLTSLFQRPLLAEGKNSVDYQLISGGSNVHSGNLIINLRVGKERTCRTQKYFSNKLSDCEADNFYQLCQRYFNELNYCQ